MLKTNQDNATFTGWGLHFFTFAILMLGGYLQGEEIVLLEAKAISGGPMGVATILIPLGNIAADFQPRVHVTDANDRVFYPGVGLEPIAPSRIESFQSDRRNGGDRRVGRGVLMEKLRFAIQSGRDAIQPPQGLRLSFLFTGESALKLSLRGDVELEVTLQPVAEPTVHAAYLSKWWKTYTSEAKGRLAKGDYPPLVETYLTSMLASRFHLPEVELREEAKKKKLDEPLSTLSLLATTDDIHRECLIASLKPPVPADRRLSALPLAPRCESPQPPDVPANLQIESIASMVPPECLYLRFGKFSNYLWYDQISSRRGGDLAQIAMMRGYNYETDIKLEKLLNTKMTTLSKLFGETVVSDMAIIGTDLYVQEGPSLGVLFEAKNGPLLRTSLMKERVAAAEQRKGQGVRLETVKIRNRDVSFLHSPDHAVRSFLVEHDRYFFVTSSRHLAERFLMIADGDPSMASRPNFRFSRLLLPEQNDYTLFAYLSPEFFRSLISPQYQIELRRRLTALSHLETAEMAMLTAKGEKVDANSIADLMQAGFLPKSFHDRVDGTQTLRDGDRWIDSLRGARGSFLPIADVEVSEASQEEIARYVEQAKFYERDWKQTDPIVVGIRRFTNKEEPKLERITLEAYVAPFGREKYGWITSQLAAPVKTKIQLPPDDVINFQVHLAGMNLGRRSIPDHVLFVGLKDMIPPKPGDTKGLIQTLRTLKETPAYLGAWPLPGYLDFLPIGIGGGPPDSLGFSRLLLGLWRWQGGGFSILSFDRSILENSIQHFAQVPAQDPAQARIKIGNLGGSQLAQWVNGVWYKQGSGTTLGNAKLLDAVHQQLHVPQADVLEVTQRLLNCRLQCPLGGEYLCGDNGAGLWNSSQTLPDNDKNRDVVPESYQAPWLAWFRGGQAHFTQLEDRLVLIGQFDVEPLPPDPKNSEPTPIVLPNMNFDLFSLPFQFMQGEKKKETGNDKTDKADGKVEKRKF